MIRPQTPWFSKPLCCRYVLAEFKTLPLPVRDGDAVKDISWRWALGLFKQDEYEVLGAWPARVSLALVALDLHVRGIEHINAIVAEASADLAPLDPDATLWPMAESGLDALHPSTAAAFGHGHRTALQPATATAERLHKSLTREIRRRAPFADEVAAATFLAQALEKADRRLYAA